MFLLYLFVACNSALDPNAPDGGGVPVSQAGAGVIDKRLAAWDIELRSIWEESLSFWNTLDSMQTVVLAVKVCADLKGKYGKAQCQAVYDDLTAIARADGHVTERGKILLSKFKGQLGL